jgi:DNA gyrase subunit A
VRIFKTDAEERVVSVERITEEEAEEAEEENGGSRET